MATIAIEEITAEASKLLASLGEGSMSPCAYDTAWVARLTRPDAPDEPLFPASFDWLLRNQRADGSWGAEIPFAHDRVISTLSALVALAGSQHRQDEAQRAVRRGVVYLNRERPNLQADPAETVGFELILPELVRQAKGLGLRLPYKDWEFVEAIKADKLRRIPPIAIYGGPTPMTHSLEFLGDRLAPMLVQRCQSPNGSYGMSPAATAYVEAQLRDADALGYLHRVAQRDSGGIPHVHPFETMETSFVLYFLEPALHGLPEIPALVQRLADSWSPMGTPWSTECSVPDADDTAVTLAVLVAHGHAMDADVFKLFETDEYFQTFVFERNPSTTANAHILHVLRKYPSTPDRRRMILKIVHYLTKTQTKGGFWHDKWHASPYYATGEAIDALTGLSNELVRRAIHWVLETQHEQGGWGFGQGTVEETALAMRALMAAGAADVAMRPLVMLPLERAATYLAEHSDQEYHPTLWIDKALYAPHNMVRAIVLGTLARWHTMPWQRIAAVTE